MNRAQRRAAYEADVTYLTAKELGFDFLRDELEDDPGRRRQRPLAFGLIDEADSVLIDEARIPLIIAGARATSALPLGRITSAVDRLLGERDYEIDPGRRTVYLTELGMQALEDDLACGPLERSSNTALLGQINTALHARVLLRRDVDYLVRDGRIELIDVLTGRVVKDRHWPDGLQAAVEAREGIAGAQEGELLGTITLQNLLNLYPSLCGMTGTARPAEEELHDFYGLETQVVPSHRPCQRHDHADHIYTHSEARDAALVNEIERSHRRGRPVLVGTASVRDSEQLAARLARAHVPCRVLNARNDEAEARIVATAGDLEAVTVSTNMAGRGVDIKLGGPDEENHDEVAALGGLLVLGANRHESRRIDNQLRGRAGRQGEPGASRFYVSLEDDLIRRHRIDELVPVALRNRRTDPIESAMLARRLDWAQRVVEGESYEIRKTLTRYAAVIEQQRRWKQQEREQLVDPNHGSTDASTLFTPLIASAEVAATPDLARTCCLRVLDRFWANHLAMTGELRESIHLERLGGKEPVHEFMRRADAHFRDQTTQLPHLARELLAEVLGDRATDRLDHPALRGPASTWTYMVNDDPLGLENGFAVAGNLGLALGAAFMWPLFFGAAVADRLRRRSPGSPQNISPDRAQDDDTLRS